MNKEKIIFALGFFDGVHLGHQALLDACRRLATAEKAVPAAVTFDLPPKAVLQGQKPNMLNTVADRKSLLHRYAMERVEVYPADGQTLRLPWQTFLEELVAMGGVGFVCGEDFRFGRGGEGNAQSLADFSKSRGFPCTVVPEQTMDGEKISSTRIRALLESGDVENANRLLGHPHILSGMVVSGKHLGRTIGVPTANLYLPEELLVPAFGVYAAVARVDDKQYPAVTNIGIRPTVDGRGITVESWLLDFDGDLYGRDLALEFHAFLRPERKFDRLDALSAQIQTDAQTAKQMLSNISL